MMKRVLLAFGFAAALAAPVAAADVATLAAAYGARPAVWGMHMSPNGDKVVYFTPIGSNGAGAGRRRCRDRGDQDHLRQPRQYRDARMVPLQDPGSRAVRLFVDPHDRRGVSRRDFARHVADARRQQAAAGTRPARHRVAVGRRSDRLAARRSEVGGDGDLGAAGGYRRQPDQQGLWTRGDAGRCRKQPHHHNRGTERGRRGLRRRRAGQRPLQDDRHPRSRRLSARQQRAVRACQGVEGLAADRLDPIVGTQHDRLRRVRRRRYALLRNEGRRWPQGADEIRRRRVRPVRDRLRPPQRRRRWRRPHRQVSPPGRGELHRRCDPV